MAEGDIKKKRIKSIIQLYYSRPEIQKAIFKFCKNREVSPRYFESFGKRPDALQYQGDIYELVKRGATSFHCSEEIWEDPLKISVDMTEKEYNELREGWDLILDIDCKWFDYAKKAAEVIIETLKRHGIKNIGIKFSGSKGFHILVPWKAFPKEISEGTKTSDLFPELTRHIINYIKYYSERIFKENPPKNLEEDFKNDEIKIGYKCSNCNEIATVYNQVELYCNFCKIGEIKKFLVNEEKKKHKCPECNRVLEEKSLKEIYECPKCNINSLKNPKNFTQSKERDLFTLMGLDLILVSPRHLFRTPYSLHEKTALASVVINEEELENFELRDADPMKIKVKNFMPNSEEGEAKELVMQALDWSKSREIRGTGDENKKITGKYAEFKPIKLKEIKDENFPPTISKILEGLKDGKKRALFVLINFFRSIGMGKEDLEKRILEWNKKNEVPLKEGYITGQLSWSYKKKPIMPPNFNSDYYKGIGVQANSEEMKMKNPVNFMIKKSLPNKKSMSKK